MSAPLTAAQRRAVAGLGVVRDLPWRATRDPWLVLMAEVAAQQTQAPRAAAAWRRLSQRFPTPASCAAARRDEVLAAWQGLGYYRRAVALHAAARDIVAVHAGHVPDDLGALRGLPGVGPYTARAVLAFAFERDVGVVDTNVARVLARAIAGERLTPAAAQRLADAAVPPGRGWAHNQAMIDLGALTCAPAPRCTACPLRACCRWRRAGHAPPDPAVDPARSSRPKAAFRGSDREARGRLLAAVLRAPVADTALGGVMGIPDDAARARRLAAQMAREGLVARREAAWAVHTGPPVEAADGRVPDVLGRRGRVRAAR